MRLLILGIILLIGNIGKGQIKPNFFPEDIPQELALICYCKPGVADKSRSRGLSFSYGFIGSGNYTPEAPVTFSPPFSRLSGSTNLELKIKVPVLLNHRTRIILGYDYFSEFYNFETIGNDFGEIFREIDNSPLKSNGYNLIISHSLDETHYLGFRYKYSLNGNYSGWTNFDSQFAIHNFMGIYGTKKSEDFEWGVGLLFSSSFRKTTALPFLLYNRTFENNWGIESVFPANFFMRYNFNPKTIALFGIEYNSESYRINTDENPVNQLDYAFNHSEIIVSARLERHLAAWFWINTKIGYQNNFSSEFEAKSSTITTFNAAPQNGLFFQVSLFLSPS